MVTVGTVGIAYGKLVARVDYLEPTVATFKTNVDALALAVKDLDPKLTALDAIVRRLDTGAGALASFGANASDLRSEVRDIQSQITAIRGHLMPAGSEPIPAGFYNEITSRLRCIEGRVDSIAVRVQAGGGRGG